MQQNKIALITGASSGFGYDLTANLLSQGWTVIATLRQLETRRDQFQQLLATHGERLHLAELDVTQPAARQTIKKLIDSRFHGRMDCLVNNAGMGLFGASEVTDESSLRKIFEVNYFGAVLLTNELLGNLRHCQGHIVVLSSLFGITGFPLTSAYCASKYALEGHFESLAMEMKPHQVKVTLVEPGGHKTRFMQNALWQIDENQTYARQQTGYQSLQKKVQQRGGGDPRQAVKKLTKAITTQRPPFRLLLGQDAWSVVITRGILGRSPFVRLISRLTNKLFAKHTTA
jgi:short-subunit dehydrogenase